MVRVRHSMVSWGEGSKILENEIWTIKQTPIQCSKNEKNTGHFFRGITFKPIAPKITQKKRPRLMYI